MFKLEGKLDNAEINLLYFCFFFPFKVTTTKELDTYLIQEVFEFPIRNLKASFAAIASKIEEVIVHH